MQRLEQLALQSTTALTPPCSRPRQRCRMQRAAKCSGCSQDWSQPDCVRMQAPRSSSMRFRAPLHAAPLPPPTRVWSRTLACVPVALQAPPSPPVRCTRLYPLYQDESELALVQSMLSDELMTSIFARIGPYSLGRAACACRQWRFLCRVRSAARATAPAAARPWALVRARRLHRLPRACWLATRWHEQQRRLCTYLVHPDRAQH